MSLQEFINRLDEIRNSLNAGLDEDERLEHLDTIAHLSAAIWYLDNLHPKFRLYEALEHLRRLNDSYTFYQELIDILEKNFDQN